MCRALVGIVLWSAMLVACTGNGVSGADAPGFSALPPAVSANLGKVALRVHSPHSPVVDVYGKSGNAQSAVEAALSDFNINQPEHLVLASFVALGAAIVGSIASLGDSDIPEHLPANLQPSIGELEEFSSSMAAQDIYLVDVSITDTELAQNGYHSTIDVDLKTPLVVGKASRSQFAVVYSVTTSSLSGAFEPHRWAHEWVSNPKPVGDWLRNDGAAISRQLNLMIALLAADLLRVKQANVKGVTNGS